METLRGFPNLPAPWLRQAEPASADALLWLLRAEPTYANAIDGNPGRVPKPGIVMETLRGFPNLPALWLRQAEPASADALLWLLRAEPACAYAL